MASEYSAAVNRVMWSPDGTLFGKSSGCYYEINSWNLKFSVNDKACSSSSYY